MRGRIVSSLKTAMDLLRRGQMAEFRARFGEAVWSERRFVGLQRDLTAKIEAPRSPVAFAIRPFRIEDLDALMTPTEVEEVAEIQAQRRRWIEGGLPGCHVATVGEDAPCFMQWLLTAADNARIREFFGDELPTLDADTVLMEGAYTPPRYRRLPIMPAAMARIAELGRSAGARRAIVFVREDNASMIKAARLAGFVPHAVQVLRRRFVRRTVTYSDLARA